MPPSTQQPLAVRPRSGYLAPAALVHHRGREDTLGENSQVFPAGTILNIAYGSNLYVAWDGTQYQVVPSLTQTFPDNWVPG